MTNVTNQRFEVAIKEKQKRGKIIKRWKTETIATKHQKVRERISLSIEEKENYESNTRDKTDLNQTGNKKNLLQFWEKEVKRKYKWLKWLYLMGYDKLKFHYIYIRI